MKSEEDEKEIEATKAPLMEHLIELRTRLIWALAAFFIMFIGCFFFAKQIYNVLTWPYVWVAGAENSKFIYTGLLEYFVVQLKVAMFGAAFLSFPVRRCRSINLSPPAFIGRSGRRFCLTWSRRRSFSFLDPWSSISW